MSISAGTFGSRCASLRDTAPRSQSICWLAAKATWQPAELLDTAGNYLAMCNTVPYAGHGACPVLCRTYRAVQKPTRGRSPEQSCHDGMTNDEVASGRSQRQSLEFQ